MNKYRDEATSTPSLQKIDPEGERRQCERVQRVRAERDAAAWAAAMSRLEDCARGQEN